MKGRKEILEEIKRLEKILMQMEDEKSFVPENQRSAFSKELMDLYKKRLHLIDAYKGLVD